MDSCVNKRHALFKKEWYANNATKEKLFPVPLGPVITTDDSFSIMLSNFS